MVYYEIEIKANTKTEREYIERLITAYFLEREEFLTRLASVTKGKTLTMNVKLIGATDYLAFMNMARLFERATGATVTLY